MLPFSICCPSTLCHPFRLRCAGGSGEAWAFTLGDLQAYLLQFPASHYASGGREPLQYAMVLVLSLQFRAAVAFLAQDAMTKDYRVDAPHIAIALSHVQVSTAAAPAS